jgi:hypothetical protein
VAIPIIARGAQSVTSIYASTTLVAATAAMFMSVEEIDKYERQFGEN